MLSTIVENSQLKFLTCAAIPCLGYGLTALSKPSSRKASRMELAFRRASAAAVVSAVVLVCWYGSLREPMYDLSAYLTLLYTLARVGTAVSDVLLEPSAKAPTRKSVLRLIGGHLVVLCAVSLAMVYERLDPTILNKPIVGHALRFMRAKYEMVSLAGFVYLFVCASIAGATGAAVHKKTLPVREEGDSMTNITVLQLAAMVGMQVALASNVYSPGTFALDSS